MVRQENVINFILNKMDIFFRLKFKICTNYLQIFEMNIVSHLLEPSFLSRPDVDNTDFALLLNGNYREFLNSNAVKDLIRSVTIEGASVNDISEDNHEYCHCIGVAALQTFISINWLGDECFNADDFNVSHDMINKDLIMDGDCLVTAVRNIELLFIAKKLLIDLLTPSSSDLGLVTWSLRCCCVLAAVLEEKSDVLHGQASNIIKIGLDVDGDKMVQALFYLQVARHHRIYFRVKEAETMTDLAAKSLGLSLTETGALGKRTKFQQKDVAQFCIDLVTDYKVSEPFVEMKREELTRDVRLEDELRLEKIKFQDSDREVREREVMLTGCQQAVLMSKYSCKVESIAVVDSLTSEEVSPYLAPVLESPQSWSLHQAALLARTKLESKEGRTVERSLAQIETCVEAVKVGVNNVMDRLKLVHVSTLPPVWEIEKLLGKILLSLGLTKAALEVYLRLEHWEEVIVCYSLLELRHKAAEVIKERLKEKETSRLWCLLGDATDDVQCYHKALELSNNKSARAYRSLGLEHYFKKEYTQSIPLFEKSLELSSFQPLLILRLAFSSMEIENWDMAAKSYRNYCSFEMDNFEAWNNLANCYIKLGQKERAWRVLQEAVRCDFDNWKVWDNLMVISLDIGAFNEVIRSYNRILDIKQVHIDNQVLNIIAKAVLDNMTDVEGNPAGKLKDKLQKFLARLTLAMPKEATAWKVYGDLVAVETSDQTDMVRCVQAYQKSLAASTSTRGWEKQEETCNQVMNICMILMEAVTRVTGVQQLQMSSSIRMSVSSASKLIHQGQTSIQTGQVKDSIGVKLEQVNNELSLLTDRIAKLREG